MKPTNDLSTYANVLANLVWAVFVLLAVLEIVTFLWLFTPGQRSWLMSHVDVSGLDQVAKVAGFGALLTGLDAGLAFLIVTFRVHQIWDTYFVHWRSRYDADFILPALLEPLTESVEPTVQQAIRLRPNLAMEVLFYPFVADDPPAVGKRLVERFHVAIMLYWMSQYFVLTLFGAAITMLLLGIGDQSQGADWTHMIPMIGIVTISGLLTHLATRRRILPRVQAATVGEIEKIHSDHLVKLERNLTDLRGRLSRPASVLDDRFWG
jgi:hypothetical protein